MGTFGERMQREREMRSISLEEIAESTKISTRMLRALEEEDFSKLPGGIFNKGFVRAYAKFLGLDEEQAVADFLTSVGESEAASPNFSADALERSVATNGSVPSRVASIEAAVAPQEASLPRQGAGFLSAAVILVIVLGAGGFFFTYYRSGKRATVASSRSVSSPGASRPSDNPTQAGTDNLKPIEQASSDPVSPTALSPDVSATAGREVTTDIATAPATSSSSVATPELAKGAVDTAFPTSAANSPDATQLARSGKLSLLVRTKEQSWMRITSDGQVVFDGMLSASSNRQFRAERELVLKMGNAAGVELSYNGKAIPPFAPESRTKTLTFTAQGLSSSTVVQE